MREDVMNGWFKCGVCVGFVCFMMIDDDDDNDETMSRFLSEWRRRSIDVQIPSVLVRDYTV
jgi:hypothetical protein